MGLIETSPQFDAAFAAVLEKYGPLKGVTVDNGYIVPLDPAELNICEGCE